eukprot:2552730-Lingulodinium_polyedra.AAC.1
MRGEMHHIFHGQPPWAGGVVVPRRGDVDVVHDLTPASPSMSENASATDAALQTRANARVAVGGAHPPNRPSAPRG